MSQEFDAIFTKGHLVPLEPVKLREHERVRVHVEQAGEESSGGTLSRDFSGMTFHDALVATGLLGSVQGEAADLSTDPRYLEGFGEHDRNTD